MELYTPFLNWKIGRLEDLYLRLLSYAFLYKAIFSLKRKTDKKLLDDGIQLERDAHCPQVFLKIEQTARYYLYIFYVSSVSQQKRPRRSPKNGCRGRV